MPEKSYYPLLGLLFLIVIIGTGSIVAVSTRSPSKQDKTEQRDKAKPLEADVFPIDIESKDTYSSATNDFFTAIVEYNPTTKSVSELLAKKTKGDMLSYLPTKPSDNPEKFIYKVEVISDKKILLFQGWEADDKKLIQTKNNTLKLFVSVPYTQNAYMYIYYPDKTILYTAFMK